MGRVVLVTGVARELGQRFARQLAAAPDVDRVVGVDVQPPRGDLGPVAFVRVDIRNPLIAKVIMREQVDTVVHMSVLPSLGRRPHRGQGAQRHRHDAAARGLPAVTGPRALRAQVEHRGVRLLEP